jgi:hypothetical protein
VMLVTMVDSSAPATDRITIPLAESVKDLLP